MINKILVPTDFSKNAENALKVAAQIAKKFKSEIYLLHFLDFPPNSIDPTTFGMNQNLPEPIFHMKLTHQSYSKIMKRPYLNGITVHETVEFHKSFKDISTVYKKYNCNLIVMSFHRKTVFQRLLEGSKTQTTIHLSNIPIITVKKTHKDFQIKSLVFTTDFSEDMKKSFLKAVEFAKNFNAKIHLLCTDETVKSSLELEKKAAFFTKDSAFQNYTVNTLNNLSKKRPIMRFAKSKKADLIGIGTQKAKVAFSFLRSNRLTRLLNTSDLPVVTFRA